MTENEAIKEFNKMIGTRMKTQRGISQKQHELFQISMDSLEEIQQYRAIGTVEECREARERQTGKKVNNRTPLRDLYGRPYTVRGDCPNCGNIGLLLNTDYCNACGQKLDWSE